MHCLGTPFKAIFDVVTRFCLNQISLRSAFFCPVIFAARGTSILLVEG
jgi:hypothetical protein